MEEFVIFKELGKYKMTTLENYEAHIRNANKVTTFEHCNSFMQCIMALGNVSGVMFYDRTGDV
jgi:hypothetical protein